MFPLYDESRSFRKTPWVTLFLIILNVTLFLISLSNIEYYIENFGFIPLLFFQGRALFSLLSSIFFHGNFFHLLSNMWYLWVFGDNVENRLGKMRFLIFYLLSGIGSGILYSITTADKLVPIIGASGAISGILAAYLILFPRHNIRTLVPLFWIWRIVSVPALFFIGIWFLYQLIYMGSDPFIAYWGHIGGFLTGLILIQLFKRGRVFDRFEI